MKITKKNLVMEITNAMAVKHSEEMVDKSSKAYKAINEILDSLTEIIRHHLIKGDEVLLSSLCSFKTVTKGEMTKYNPRLKDYCYIPESKKIKVTVSKKITNSLN